VITRITIVKEVDRAIAKAFPVKIVVKKRLR